MPSLLKWGFWVSPVTYGQIGLAVNEFHATRWQKVSFFLIIYKWDAIMSSTIMNNMIFVTSSQQWPSPVQLSYLRRQIPCYSGCSFIHHNIILYLLSDANVLFLVQSVEMCAIKHFTGEPGA